MNKTIKISLFTVALLTGVDALAAGTQLTFQGRSQVTGGSGNQCEATQENITVKLSANVAGAYECDSKNVALVTGNLKGKGTAYTVHSGGGAPTPHLSQGAGTGGKFQDQSDVETVTAGLTGATLTASNTTSD